MSKLAELATEGKVYGVDHSEASVGSTARTNARQIAAGRVDVRLASVFDLPFADDTFDLVTAVETHFWWPQLPSDIREVRRVLKPAGLLMIAAEIYKGAGTMLSRLAQPPRRAPTSTAFGSASRVPSITHLKRSATAGRPQAFSRVRRRSPPA